MSPIKLRFVMFLHLFIFSKLNLLKCVLSNNSKTMVLLKQIIQKKKKKNVNVLRHTRLNTYYLLKKYGKTETLNMLIVNLETTVKFC